MDLSPFKTQEAPDLIFFETTHFVALVLGLVAYGITTAVCVVCVYYLLTTSKNLRTALTWVSFVVLAFSGATLNILGDVLAHINGWVLYRGFPGGPSSFFLQVSVFGAADWATYLLGILVDALLIYRVYMVYGRWYIITLPVAMLLAAAALGPFFVLQISGRNHDWFSKHTLDFSIPYFAVELSLNILLTLLLVVRLWHMSRRVGKVLGKKHGKVYAGVARMIVESSLPYALVSLVLLVLFVKKNLGANVVIPLYVQIQCMTPTLIILRVCLGRAWDKNTLETAESTERRHWGKGPQENGKRSILRFRHTSDEDDAMSISTPQTTPEREYAV
ncbi:hypothetical protein BJ165DRAFT_1535726 [Panaeolus papilionaceus]|nr:hypothetical protein BJ165DRAFT_1535726 [Panaeolus papilionaceus]